MARIYKGRRKIEMVKIQNKNNRRVTFSKRRPNLFKKASELACLCDVEVVLIVRSSTGKIYKFGHPSVETVIERYLGNISNNHQSFDDDKFITEAQRNMLSVDLSRELQEKERKLEIEKSTTVLMEEKIKNSPLAKIWSKFPDDELSMEELLQLKTAVEKLKMDIEKVERKKTLEMIQFMGFNKTSDHQNVGESSSTGAARHGGLQNVGESSFTGVVQHGKLVELDHDLQNVGKSPFIDAARYGGLQNVGESPSTGAVRHSGLVELDRDRQNVGESPFTGATRYGGLQNIGESSSTGAARRSGLVEFDRDRQNVGESLFTCATRYGGLQNIGESSSTGAIQQGGLVRLDRDRSIVGESSFTGIARYSGLQNIGESSSTGAAPHDGLVELDCDRQNIDESLSIGAARRGRLIELDLLGLEDRHHL